ncbi:hypothetical protein M8A51_21860 [Schlegelella sp. S2-27]|uniref:Uncharacterized protein n=1 Tax=Caldimonas mangrovi TaxID=2944811 RepID=A0ABT0YU82_9BURK|nr:hypothetical protein [Caldimonas mangrovi]MCM5682183.1 hypothetical protein [Caldimonas mangrovi]
MHPRAARPVEAPSWRRQWAHTLIDKVVLAVIVFVATSAANLWFDQQKATAALRLTDSNLITESATALWKDIGVLQGQYGALHQARREQWFAKTMLRQPGKEADADIQQRAETLRQRKDELSRKVCAEEHVIGEPMVRHLLQYLYLLDGYYESEAKALEASDPEAQKFNREMAKGLADVLATLRLDVVSTREYALRQVSR